MKAADNVPLFNKISFDLPKALMSYLTRLMLISRTVEFNISELLYDEITYPQNLLDLKICRKLIICNNFSYIGFPYQ